MISIAVTSYGISDIKSVFGIVGSASTFSADVIQTELINIGIATIIEINNELMYQILIFLIIMCIRYSNNLT